MRQLRLAQAWARNQADDEIADAKNTKESNDSNDSSAAKKTGQNAAAATATTTTPGGSAATEQDRPGTETGGGGVSYKTLDEETERDILLARERREANDRYFDRVNNGVLDVVAKLEDVAQAMRVVERESKDIWSESETSPTSPSSHADTS